MSPRRRFVILLVSLALLGSVAVTYTAYAVRRANGPTQPVAGKELDLSRPGQVIFRNTEPGAGFGRVASVALDRPRGDRAVSALSCDRVYASAGQGVCLARDPGSTDGFEALILSRRLGVVRRIEPPGIPNRARLAPDGRFAAWTAFVSGHSYATTGFSTRTSIVDLRSRKLYRDLETLRIFRDGVRYRAPDINIWGVTFAPDSERFFASMASDGRTYLIEGSLKTWQAETLRENAECPSISPDGRRVAFKKRVQQSGSMPWQLAVLDLATMKETLLAGTAGVDDQAAWLDDRTVLYGMARSARESHVWAAPVTGGSPRLLIENAASPSVTG